jgi:hypothetical protein
MDAIKTASMEAARLAAFHRARSLALRHGEFTVVIRSGDEYHAALEDDTLHIWAGATVVANIGPDGEVTSTL